jgi:hypothetical protein
MVFFQTHGEEPVARTTELATEARSGTLSATTLLSTCTAITPGFWMLSTHPILTDPRQSGRSQGSLHRGSPVQPGRFVRRPVLPNAWM